MDIADLADRYIEDHVLSALHRMRKKRLSNTAAAHHCDECGAEIPQARRQAVPGCTLCVSCADVHERRQAGYTRPYQLKSGDAGLDDYLYNVS